MGVYEIKPCNIYAPSALRVISEMIMYTKRELLIDCQEY